MLLLPDSERLAAACWHLGNGICSGRWDRPSVLTNRNRNAARSDLQSCVAKACNHGTNEPNTRGYDRVQVDRATCRNIWRTPPPHACRNERCSESKLRRWSSSSTLWRSRVTGNLLVTRTLDQLTLVLTTTAASAAPAASFKRSWRHQCQAAVSLKRVAVTPLGFSLEGFPNCMRLRR